jgi:hypothetical protein
VLGFVFPGFLIWAFALFSARLSYTVVTTLSHPHTSSAAAGQKASLENDESNCEQNCFLVAVCAVTAKDHSWSVVLWSYIQLIGP